jgi:hypothetical protein
MRTAGRECLVRRFVVVVAVAGIGGGVIAMLGRGNRSWMGGKVGGRGGGKMVWMIWWWWWRNLGFAMCILGTVGLKRIGDVAEDWSVVA